MTSLPERPVMPGNSDRKLGAQLSKPLAAPVGLELVPVGPPAFPPPPAVTDWIMGVVNWEDLGNSGFDAVGNCVPACAAHVIEAWTDVAGTRADITEPEVRRVYAMLSGYIPGNPATDKGMPVQTLMDWWRSTGFGSHRIDRYAQSNAIGHAVFYKPMIKMLVSYYGTAILTFHMPDAATYSSPGQIWMSDMGPGNGYHCVPALAYDDNYCDVITWGRVQRVTWDFVSNYLTELWGVASVDWTGPDQTSVTGHSKEYLMAHLPAVVTIMAR